MKTSYLVRWLFSALLATFFVASAMSVAVAQTSNTGTVTGVVKDEKGALVPGASIGQAAIEPAATAFRIGARPLRDPAFK